ncbi:unnamed protein product [Adineta steineri]|uniref:Uncharacterized protein n=1 Tax=Adineta steineri TaxID=433720 RepID=A0A814JAH3_9BILA|nr:unnamed protein product [Adineta steineri]CAF1077273.1 unnamed protein product [Adineta steineri]
MSLQSIPIYKRPLFSISTVHDDLSDNYDIVIIFHASQINTIEYVNPYFVATIDNQISFTSTSKWTDEEWIIRKIPRNAKLLVKIYNKNEKELDDNYIGEFEILNIINYDAPPNGPTIVDSYGQHKGHFHLSIDSKKSSNESQQLPCYTFDGPCRYSRYDFFPINHHTERIYSTWTIQLRRILSYFPSDQRQQWNRQYKPVQQVTSDYLGISTAHNMMALAQKTFNEKIVRHDENGQLRSADDLWKLVLMDKTIQQIRPRIYTYIIDDTTWQFTEIDPRVFADSTIKHARLANWSEYICYAGEFHLRPKFGWTKLNDEWELVFDNASGTYSPNAELLINLKKLLLFNFPGLNITTYDYKDPMLRDSIEQLEIIARKYKNIGRQEQ